MKKCNICKKTVQGYYLVKIDNIHAGYVCIKDLKQWNENIRIRGWEPEVFYMNREENIYVWRKANKKQLNKW